MNKTPVVIKTIPRIHNHNFVKKIKINFDTQPFFSWFLKFSNKEARNQWFFGGDFLQFQKNSITNWLFIGKNSQFFFATMAYNIKGWLRFSIFIFWTSWLNILMDDHQLSNITKLKNKTPHKTINFISCFMKTIGPR